MKWIIEGAKKAYDKDFKIKEPKIVEDAINAYRENNDWLGQFLDDCCIVGKDETCKSGELYQTYRSYCLTNGEYIRSTTDFYGAVDNAGFIRRKTRSNVVVYGVRLKDENILD